MTVSAAKDLSISANQSNFRQPRERKQEVDGIEESFRQDFAGQDFFHGPGSDGNGN